MKTIYTEPVIEVFIFEKRDQIKASTEPIVTATATMAEDDVGVAEGDAGDFIW